MGVLFVFVGAASIAIGNLITRKFASLASSYESSFFSMGISSIIFLIAMSLNFQPMRLKDLCISMGGGFFAGFGVMAIIHGARVLPASIFGMTSYFQLLYGVLLGWLFFYQLPTTQNIIGISFVMIAGFLLFILDKQKIN
jgi:S-adenosylmethionine uptake transporter